jgi:predicted MFS family arabinose efflux permease
MQVEAERDLESGLTRSEWMLLIVLAAIQFSHSMDFMVMMPLGPKCREELDISPKLFTLLMTSYGFSAAIAGLCAAWFIDRFDRKTALLSFYAGLTLGTLLCAVAPGYWTLVLARSVAGAFGGIGASFILVIIGDSFPEIRRGRATGVVMTAFSLASIAGIPLGVLLGNRFGAQMPFAVLGVFCLAVLIAAVRILPSMRGHMGRQHTAGETWAILVQPGHIRAYLFVIVLVIGNFTIAPNFSDFLVHNVGRDKDDLAIVYFAGGLVTVVTLPLIGRWADRFGKRIMFRITAGCTFVIVLVLTNFPRASMVPLLTATMLYWIFTSGRWVSAMAMVTSSALPRYRGGFMSVNASVQQMAIGLASAVAGVVVGEGESGELTGYWLAGLIAALSTIASIVLASGLTAAEEPSSTEFSSLMAETASPASLVEAPLD